MKENTEYILKKEFLVSSADVDFEQKLRYSSLTNYLIQAAWEHAEQLKWGADDLIKHNLVWVLAGFTIEMDELPLWRDTITIETWPKGLNRLVYLRDFHIYNSKGACVGRASTNWILIDITSRRPKVLRTDSEVFEQNLNKHAIPVMATAIRYATDTEKEVRYITRYSDIDLNEHLTTTRYVDLIFDTFSLEEVSEARPKRLSVSFKKEVKFDSQITISRSVLNKGVRQFQISSEDGGCHFIAEIGY